MKSRVLIPVTLAVGLASLAMASNAQAFGLLRTMYGSNGCGCGAAQKGAVQKGAVQKGAVQKGAVQKGAAQKGAAQKGGDCCGAKRTRSRQPLFHRCRTSCAPKCGVAQKGGCGAAVQKCGAAQKGAVQKGAAQKGSDCCGTKRTRCRQPRFHRCRTRCAPKCGAAQKGGCGGAVQKGAVQKGAVQKGAVQKGAAQKGGDCCGAKRTRSRTPLFKRSRTSCGSPCGGCGGCGK